MDGNAKVTINGINDLDRRRLLPRSRLQGREPRAPIRDNEQDIEGRTTPPRSGRRFALAVEPGPPLRKRTSFSIAPCTAAPRTGGGTEHRDRIAPLRQPLQTFHDARSPKSQLQSSVRAVS